MNADRLIGMVINRVVRTVVNKGVDGAISAAGGGKKGKRPDPEVRQQQKQAKQAMRMMRRAGRM